MKVTLAIKYLHERYGGAEQMVCHTANVLAERGHKVTIVVNEAEGPKLQFDTHPDVAVRNASHFFGPHNPRVLQASATLEPMLLDQPTVWPLARQWLTANRGFAQRWGSAVLEDDPDVVVAYMPHTYVPLLYALGSQLPVVASFQSSPAREFTLFSAGEDDENWRCLFSRFLSVATSATVLLPTLVPELTEFYKGKIFVRPNFVDLSPGRRIKTKRRRLIAAGRFVEVKDFPVLISAMPEAVKAFPDTLLALFGDGEQRGHLERLVRSYWLQYNVVLPGVSDRIPQLMSLAQACVVPSKVEGFGLVALEAMACAVPVIGFEDCVAVKEHVTSSGAGLLASCRDPSALATRIIELLSSPALVQELGEKGRSYALEFTRQAYSEGYEAIIKQARGL